MERNFNIKSYCNLNIKEVSNFKKCDIIKLFYSRIAHNVIYCHVM